MRLRFPMVKLLDYRQRWSELENSNNPFAILVMAHLKTQETRRQPQQRLAWKLSIVKSLYQRGYNREEIRALFGLIDWMMKLPKFLEQGFQADIDLYQQENKMPYVTSIERVTGRNKARSYIIDNLEARFGEVPVELVEAIQQTWDQERLDMIHRQAAIASSLHDFHQWLEQLPPEEEEEIEDVV